LRAEYLIDAVGLNKIQGKPFLVNEIEEKIEQMLANIGGPATVNVEGELIGDFVDDASPPR